MDMAFKQKRFKNEILLFIFPVLLTLLAHLVIYYARLSKGLTPEVTFITRHIIIMCLFIAVYIILKILKYRGTFIPLMITALLTGINLSLHYRFGYSSNFTYELSIVLGIILLLYAILLFRDKWVEILQKRYYLLFGITLLLLLIWGIISQIYHTRFLFSRTPWELTKIPIVFVTAGFLSEYTILLDKRNSIGTLFMFFLIPLFALWFMPQLMFILMGDLGQILIFSLFIVILVFSVSGRFVFIIGGFVLFILGIYTLPLLYGILPGYAVERLTMWSDFWNGFPSNEWFNRMYQPVNALFAVHAGSVFGSGFGMGYPGFIPQCSTDFIYPVLAEEIGFLGTSSIMLIYFSLVITGLAVGFSVRNRFLRFSVLGFTIMIGVQVFINSSGVLMMIPLTGIPLPFISKGGFAYLTFSFMIGFIMAASEQGEERMNNLNGFPFSRE